MPPKEFFVFREFTNRKALRAIELDLGFGIDVSALCIFKMLHKLL